MKAFELKEKTREELRDLLAGFQKELFNLRVRRIARELPNPLRLRMIRRDIARIKTFLREEELGKRKLIETKKTAPKAKPQKKGEDRAKK
jgi:large subunit ribosomal protein L29